MKTMKTKWAKAGTMFLAAAAVLSSCSNEEVIPGGETPVGERDAVKTSFSFAIPSLPATMFKATTISWV